MFRDILATEKRAENLFEVKRSNFKLTTSMKHGASISVAWSLAFG